MSELLVIVSPRIVEPSDEPLAIPTGEPETWEWVERLAPESDASTPDRAGGTPR